MEGSISGRQAGAWGFCAASVPAVLTCAGLGWGWVLLGCAIAAGYYVLTQELANGAVYLPELTVRAFGNAAGRTTLVIGGAFTLLAAAQTARRAGIAFPDGTAELAGGVIVLLGTLAGEKGAKQATKVCGVLFLVLAGLYTIIILAAAKNVQLRWMEPWGGARQTLEVVPPLLVLTCLRFLPGRKAAVKSGWLGLLAVCPAAFAALTAGCLSPRLTQQLTFPFYTVSQSLSVLGVMERLEPIVSAALFMGFFALESLLLEAGREQIERAAPIIAGKRWARAALGIAVFGLSFLTDGIPAEVWALGAAVCWGIVPLLTQLIVAIK